MSEYDEYNDDNQSTSMHDRVRHVLPWVKFISRALPLLAVLMCVAYLISQRTALFPDSNTSANPPVAQTLAFPPQQPLTTKPAKPTNTTTGKKPVASKTGSSSTGTSITPGNASSTATGTAETTAARPTNSSTTGTGGSASTINPTDKPAKKIDWKKTEITGPIEGAYVAVFLSRKAVTLVVGKEYARVYYHANFSPAVKPGNYRVLEHKLLNGAMTIILSYPSTEDAAKALAAGTITRAQYDAIISAHKQQKSPPFNIRLKGPLVIRESTASTPPKAALDIIISKQQIEELWIAIRKGTVVRIVN